jgi:leucyl-tRNA synthetase
VQRKEVKQWFFKITDYADELLEAIDDLDWTESVKLAQKNWIGRSEGAEIEFVLPKIGDDETALKVEIKDTLKFTPELTALVQNGDKTSTLRLEPKQLAVGDYAKLQTRYAADVVRSFAIAQINGVQTKKLRDIANDYEGHEPFESEADKLATYQGYYGQDVSLDTEFVIYDFTVITDIMTVFTTRPDTIYGATFLVVAPDHIRAQSLATGDQVEAVKSYIQESLLKSEVERQTATQTKTGVFTGSYAINPVNNKRIPVWIADYVLAGYGTGAIMAVPAHDERDWEFAQTFDLPHVYVFDQKDAAEDGCYAGEGIVKNSGKYDGKPSNEVRESIIADLEINGDALAVTNYKMRDWSVSRQRYWGAPIPIIDCPKCGTVLVLDDQLPVILPELDDFQPSGDGRSALARATDWLHVECPECGGPAERETDTLDTYICSSWYMLRYLDPHNQQQIFDSATVNKWMPIDFYNGADHATAHLLYARFITRFFTKIGLVDNPEPFKQMLFNGKVTAADGSAFSKSKGNGIDPLEIIESGYGADALRTYLMFASPLEIGARWDSQGVPGAHRFLARMWNLVQEYNELAEIDLTPEHIKSIRFAEHRMIKKVSDDIEGNRYNTAIAASMTCVNDFYKLKTTAFGKNEVWHAALSSLVACVGPFAPHIAEELWHQLGHSTTVNHDSWPVHDEAYLQQDFVTIAVQVNGKLRGELSLAPDADEAAVVAAAHANERIESHLSGTTIRKTIYVPGRLVNFVV